MTNVRCSVEVARLLGMTPTTVAMIAALDVRHGLAVATASRRSYVVAHVTEGRSFTGMWLWRYQLQLTADDVGVYPTK